MTHSLDVRRAAFATAISLTFLLAGCLDISRRDAELERLAENFSAQADRCLLDVRDNNMAYDQAKSCKSLSGLSMAYINAGAPLTFDGSAVPRYGYSATKAVSTAWTAVALSNARHRELPPVFSLW